mmetsp:Transcript_109058/g.348137  ORF Transcript_109058/g.348137 Transcript_109058/m.348137 type:complete len:179 (-) Transcript_109058:395-931(-)
MPEPVLPAGCCPSTAAGLLDLFEAMVAAFAQERFGVVRRPTRAGAEIILRDPDFARVRRCQFSFQLDRGSLAIHRIVARRVLAFSADKPVGWAMRLGCAWDGKPLESVALAPHILARDDWAEVVVNICTSVSLLAGPSARLEVGWLQPPYTLEALEQTVAACREPLQWPFGRACRWVQ